MHGAILFLQRRKGTYSADRVVYSDPGELTNTELLQLLTYSGKIEKYLECSVPSHLVNK